MRFGSALYFQYGPNIYQVLVDPVQSGRWYSVAVTYQGQRIDVSVDGVLKYSTVNPLVPGAPFQGFGTTGWEVPGAAYIDMLQARPLPTGLVVEPQQLKFRRPAGSGLSRKKTRLRSGLGRTTEEQDDIIRAHRQVRRTADTSGRARPARSAAAGVRGKPRPVAAAGPVPRPRDGAALFLTDDGFVVRTDSAALRHSELSAAHGPAPRMEALEPLPGKEQLPDRRPRSWVTDVARFAKVAYRGVYPGVDLVAYGKQGELEYDLVVAPGADPSRIRLSFAGADRLRLDEAGHLVLETPAGEVRQLKPHVYQERWRDPATGGRPLRPRWIHGDVPGGRLRPHAAAGHRPRHQLLDLPGSRATTATTERGIAVDPDGNAYVTGTTTGSRLPDHPRRASSRRGRPPPRRWPSW